MNGADWVIIVVVLASTVQAAYSGFFQEAFHLAGLVAGYLVAAWQYQRLAGWFEKYLKSPWLAESAGFLVIFFAIVLLFGLAARVARWLMKETGLSGFDRFLGAILGLLKGALMAAVILMGMTAFEPTSKLLQSSQLAPYFLVLGRAAIWVAPTELRARFYQGLDLLHQAQPKLAGSHASPPK